MKGGAWIALGLIVALFAGCGGASPEPGAAASDLNEAAPLRPFFQALQALEQGSAAGPVAVLQLGDSHTANDAFSGRMRGRLQARFGDAGRGMLPPGIPFRLYRPAGVKVSASGWRTVGSLLPADPGPFGLAGVRQVATGPAEMTLSADAPDGFDEVLIEALGQPGGGSLDVTAGLGEPGPVTPGPVTLRTNAPAGTPLWLNLQLRHPEVSLRSRGDGPVTLLSWSVRRHRPGVTWSNLGTIGATIDTLGRFDPVLVKAELEHARPALIVVAFGTNEGFNDQIDPGAYAASYAANLAALRAAAPQAAILVVGPPDGNRRAGAGMQACPAPADGSADRTTWTVPPKLAELREVQRRVAQAKGFYFWDWSAAMGGACAMQAWARSTPPLASADHVHLLTAGYAVTADKLFDELMRHYDRFRDAAHRR